MIKESIILLWWALFIKIIYLSCRYSGVCVPRPFHVGNVHQDVCIGATYIFWVVIQPFWLCCDLWLHLWSDLDRSEAGLVRPVSAPRFALAQDIQSHKVSCDFPSPASFQLVYSVWWVILWVVYSDKGCIYVSYVAWSSVLVTWPMVICFPSLLMHIMGAERLKHSLTINV